MCKKRQKKESIVLLTPLITIHTLNFFLSFFFLSRDWDVCRLQRRMMDHVCMWVQTSGWSSVPVSGNGRQKQREAITQETKEANGVWQVMTVRDWRAYGNEVYSVRPNEHLCLLARGRDTCICFSHNAISQQVAHTPGSELDIYLGRPSSELDIYLGWLSLHLQLSKQKDSTTNKQTDKQKSGMLFSFNNPQHMTLLTDQHSQTPCTSVGLFIYSTKEKKNDGEKKIWEVWTLSCQFTFNKIQQATLKDFTALHLVEHLHSSVCTLV